MDTAIKVVVAIMEILFFIGVAGSLVVVVWTSIEDCTLFSVKSEEKPEEYLTANPNPTEQSQLSSNA